MLLLKLAARKQAAGKSIWGKTLTEIRILIREIIHVHTENTSDIPTLDTEKG